MARMYPAEPSPATQSDAEKFIFAKFKDELPDDVLVLHSLGLGRHLTKPWAEIDFVVIAGEGVFCLEVKGGNVRRERTTWYTNENKLKESPFQQVGSASTALFKELLADFPRLKQAVVGNGVIFPDVVFDASGSDILPEVVYDADDITQPAEAYLQRIAAYWRDRLTPADKFRPLSHRDRSDLVDALAGDFNLVRTLRREVESVERELVRLTEEQTHYVDTAAETDRVLVKGGAGTGKTLLATAEAERLGSEGMTVLFCCFNRQLAAYLSESVIVSQQVQVWGFHQWLYQVISDAGALGRVPDAEPSDLFRTFYPELVAELLVNRDEPPFDALVVDELQDLAVQPYVDVLDVAVRGGLAGGVWRAFYDPLQNLFEATDREAFEQIRDSAEAKLRLDVNCRNTAAIANRVCLMTGLRSQEVLTVEGPDVEIETYDEAMGPSAAVASRLEKWLGQGLKSDEIVVLSPRRLEKSAVRTSLPAGLRLVDGETIDRPSNRSVCFHTIQSYKGLDSAAVILVDVEDFFDDRQRSAIYVGGSRARSLLSVCIPQSSWAGYEQRAEEYGAALVEQST